MSFAKQFLCILLIIGVLVPVSGAVRDAPDSDLWSKFETVRQGTRVLHQVFDVTRRVKGGYSEQASHHQITIDLYQSKWRAELSSGSGEFARVFDGQSIYLFEPGGVEFVRLKRNDKEEALPEPYDNKVDWGKAKEIQRLPCGFSGKDHPCVIIEAPIKPWVRPDVPGSLTKMTDGTIRIMIDTETGIWLNCRLVATVEGPMTVQVDVTYAIQQMTYGAASDAVLFKLPEGLHEVKQLTRWNESSIKKELVGKPAPDLHLTDIQGKRISLTDLKGKTVLLDFWTTWCPPCQADASSVEKLNKKYGGKSLAIIGISVDEDRATVQGYLKTHPHDYSVVLSSENQLPWPYQIGEFPTYMIIGPDGIVKNAEAGDQGFGRLRKDLEKAGMPAD